MKNRTLHVRGKLLKQDFENAKQDCVMAKQDSECLVKAGITIRSANNVLKLIQEFGFDCSFNRTDIMKVLNITKSPASELLRKLLSIGAVVLAKEQGKGMYKFSLDFFKQQK